MCLLAYKLILTLSTYDVNNIYKYRLTCNITGVIIYLDKVELCNIRINLWHREDQLL